MDAKSAQSRKWVGRALRAGRAAAFLVLATGINGTISALYPRYEPIYVYLASVVVVAWLGSALLGVTTAVAAVILYDWMFSPLQSGLSANTAIPLVIAVGAALATRLVKAPIARAQIAPTAPPPLLPVLDAEVVPKPAPVDDGRIDELERRVAAARVRQTTLESELAAARAELERQAREADGARKQLETAQSKALEIEERNSALQRELNTARPQLTQYSKQSDGVRAELEAAQRRIAEVEARSTDLQRVLDEVRLQSVEHETKAAALQQELDLAWGRADEEKTRADREAALRTRLERAAGQEAQQAVAAATAKYESTIREAKSRLEAVEEEKARLEKELGEQQKRGDREAMLRTQLEAAARETLQRTAGVSASHQRTATEAQVAARRAEERIRELEEQLSATVTSLDEERQRREQAEVSASSRVETLSAELASRHEMQLSGIRELIQSLQEGIESAQAELDEQRAELASERVKRTAEAAEAAHKLEEEIATRARLQKEWDTKLERIVAGITTDYEESLGEAMVAREGAKAEARTLTKKVEQLKADLDAARAAAKAADQEWSSKLERIVAGITTDYEESLGEALVAREAAKAELRVLTSKADKYRHDLDAATKQLEQQKAERDKLELEWSDKLQKIVTHLASDHEADLGEAMLEKEAAKAEARSFKGRASMLQQKLEQEREMFLQWKERWKSERLELGGVPKATLTDGQIPLPSVGGGAVILLVHTDLAIRLAARNALEQSGYVVVEAGDGLEALRTAGTIKPDVVLAEAVMPKMNGRELVQLLKSKRETADVKIVLMTGAFSINYDTDFKADDFIRNPRDLAAMKETLAKVLKKPA